MLDPLTCWVWISGSALDCRSLQTETWNTASVSLSARNISYGVPQGAGLGPLIFNVFSLLPRWPTSSSNTQNLDWLSDIKEWLAQNCIKNIADSPTQYHCYCTEPAFHPHAKNLCAISDGNLRFNRQVQLLQLRTISFFNLHLQVYYCNSQATISCLQLVQHTADIHASQWLPVIFQINFQNHFYICTTRGNYKSPYWDWIKLECLLNNSFLNQSKVTLTKV